MLWLTNCDETMSIVFLISHSPQQAYKRKSRPLREAVIMANGAGSGKKLSWIRQGKADNTLRSKQTTA